MSTSTPSATEFVQVPGNPAPEDAELAWVEGLDGRRIRVCLAPSLQAEPRGTVLVCPGRTEFIEKYFEVARELQDRGFCVLIIDWPGQGLSDRLLPDRLKGHVDSFETFTEALRRAVDHFGERLPRPHVILAHSMGGAISLSALVKGTLRAEAAAFAAPMWGLPVPFFASALASLIRSVGLGGLYTPGQGGEETFETNPVTHDQKRWARQKALIEAAPSLALGPATWGWLGVSLGMLKQVTRPAFLSRVDIPVFVASAGEEKLVDNGAHARVAAALPNCEHITIEGAMHEILMETDDKRTRFWSGFDRMLATAGF